MDAEFSGQVGSLVVWPQHILSFWKKRPTAFSGAVADVVGGGESGRNSRLETISIRSSNIIGKSRISNFQFFQNHFVIGFEFCHSHFESFFSNGSSKKKPDDQGSLCRSGAL